MEQKLLLIAFIGFAIFPEVEVLSPPISVCSNCQLLKIGACTVEQSQERCPLSCGKNEECCDNCCGGQSCIKRQDNDVSQDSCNFHCRSRRRPVCGTDGVTYQNPCKLKRAICKNPKLSRKHRGTCTDGLCKFRCSRKRNKPICGTDGVTYRNRCELKKAICRNPELCEKHTGECVVDPCQDIYCDIPQCLPGQVVDYNGPGCCPGCKVDCSTVRCMNTVCKDGYVLVVPEDSCCGECQEVKDRCQTVVCPLIKCARGYISEIKGSDCCPTCVLDCSTILCPQVACKVGSERFVPDGSCCPDCRPSLGVCPLASKRNCIKGGPDDIPGCESDSDCKGTQKCCPDVCRSICKDPEKTDCSLVLCPQPLCREGYEIYTPDGECCPSCRPIMDQICSLPEEVGQCKAAIPRWRFNIEKCACEQFTYGGCGGNDNNFETEKTCTKQCGDSNIVNCFVNPCEFATCPGYKNARCVANYCGGCNALWYVNDERITCNDCSLLDCPIPACLKGHEIYTPEGECCPQCRPINGPNEVDCSLVLCALPDCLEGHEIYTPEGECCPDCRPINVGDACEEPPICITLYQPICGSNGVTYGNECEFNYAQLCDDSSLTIDYYQECEKPDCRLVRCAQPLCLEGHESYTPDGECCPLCRPIDDCSLFACAAPECLEGQEIYTPEGECCPHCRPINVCNLPLEVGPCEALIPRWGFGDGECVEFNYGGCEGNENNFESQAECEEVCESG